MNTQVQEIRQEIGKVISGKNHVIKKVLTAVFAGGHILLEDIPGVGKTTLALAMSRVLDLDFNRVQFTPDVVPSDITGFTMYDKNTGNFIYRDGAANCNFFLADEINRTSSKTQSALLEVMQEGKITVDGETHVMPQPFIVMATQNPIGTSGTQMLPEAQLDRFMIKLSMGYPDFEAQVDILKAREKTDPLNEVHSVISREELLKMKEAVKEIYIDDKIYRYITSLVEATRRNQYIKLGASPRAAIALCQMGRATAYIEGRDFVTPEDIQSVFCDVTRHRIMLHPKAHIAEETEDSVLQSILQDIDAPKTDK